MSTPTVGDLIDETARYFAAAELFYGHGTDNPRDEAAALVFHVLRLDHSGPASQYALPVAAEGLAEVRELAEQRVGSRQPLAYLLGEAWFCGLPFHVDQRVLVPRSPVAELIHDRFEPWIDSAQVRSILDIGTGSGCIAIACALAFPEAAVTATDISADALEVADLNCRRHAVAARVKLKETDLAAGLQGPFDVIISNPPYVPDAEADDIPAEYGHEPALGLYSGADGLDSARRILQDAPALLSPDGILVLEVGAQWEQLGAAFPQFPFTWLEFEHGGTGVGVLQAADLQAGQD